jgi:hypothetical protein
MIHRKSIAVCLLAALLAAIIPGRIARSDAAPPRVPSGSNVIPGQETKVRMVAENVLLWILKRADGKYHAEVTADFNFRNQGAAAESLQVRFPMEDVDGEGDGYGNRPLIRNFSAQADGVPLAIQSVSEPFKYGPPVQWSTFPVSFPVGRDVLLRVQYETDLTSGKYSTTWLGYILETGYGWYGTIGSAVITYRFPYAVSPVNTLNPPNAVQVGNEVRFLYSDFEPDSSFNINLTFANPAVWQRVLDLERYTGEHPTDIPSILQLAGTYEDLCILNPAASLLAETIIEEALTYSPDSADLHAEWASTYFDRIPNFPMTCATFNPLPEAEIDQAITGLQRELNRALELDPHNARALQLQSDISNAEINNPDVLSTSTPTIPATKAAEAATPEESTSTPSSTLISTPTAENTQTPVAAGGSGGKEGSQAMSAGIPAGWLIVAALAGLAVGILFPASWKQRFVRPVIPGTKPRQ